MFQATTDELPTNIIYKDKGKNLMSQSVRVLKFRLVVYQIRDVYTSLTCTWKKRETLSLGLVNYLYCRFVEVIRTPLK